MLEPSTKGIGRPVAGAMSVGRSVGLWVFIIITYSVIFYFSSWGSADML